MSLSVACGDKPEEALPSGPITVTGRVWKTLGVPETKALVFIPGNDRKPVVVDTQGAFTIPNVTAPYELIVRMDDNGKAYARVYKELTLKDPTVLNFASLGASAETQNNTLTGRITGQQSAPETSQVRVSHALPMRHGFWVPSAYGGATQAEASGAFSFKSDWSLDPAETGSLFALQYTLDKEHPQRYLAYGRRDNVGFQKSPPAMDIALSPVSSTRLSVDITGAATDATHHLTLNMEHTPSLVTYLDSQETTSAASSFPVPEVPGATFQLVGYATGVKGAWTRTGLKAGESLKVVLPPDIKPIAPAEGAQGVAPTSTFAWTPFPDGAYTHLIICGEYRVVIDQLAPQLTLPDLSAVGISLKGDVTCQWTGYAFSPARSANQMLGFNYPRQQEVARTDVVYLSYFGSYFQLAK